METNKRLEVTEVKRSKKKGSNRNIQKNRYRRKGEEKWQKFNAKRVVRG